MTYNPWRDLGARADITFGVTDLPAGDGWWIREVPAIVLGRHLSRVERRCVLAHELVHAEHDEQQCAHDGPGTARIARRREADADLTAACRLISLDDLADALRWALGVDEVAEVLDVTQHLVRVRLRNLSALDKAWIESRLDIEHRGIA